MSRCSYNSLASHVEKRVITTLRHSSILEQKMRRSGEYAWDKPRFMLLWKDRIQWCDKIASQQLLICVSLRFVICKIKLIITQIKSRDFWFFIYEYYYWIHIAASHLCRSVLKNNFLRTFHNTNRSRTCDLIIIFLYSVNFYKRLELDFFIALIATHFLVESKLLVITSQIYEIKKIFCCRWFQCCWLWRLSMVIQCGHFFIKIFLFSSHFISIFLFTI